MKIITHDLNHDLIFNCTHTQSIVCATVDSQCLDYLGYITLTKSLKNPESAKVYTIYIKNQDKVELKITRRLTR